MASLRDKQQFARFAIVGSANTALDFGLLFMLRSAGLPIVVANLISSTTAFVSSFVANKKYTFKTEGSDLKRELTLFIVVTLFGLWILQSIVLWALTPPLENVLGNHQYALFAAKLLATVVSMTWNYILYTKLVFKRSTNSSGR